MTQESPRHWQHQRYCVASQVEGDRTMSDIESVARAIQREMPGSASFNWAPDLWMTIARAAIAALSAPPQAREATRAALEEIDALIDAYGIDTVGTGSRPTRKEDRRVAQILERSAARHSATTPAPSPAAPDLLPGRQPCLQEIARLSAGKETQE